MSKTKHASLLRMPRRKLLSTKDFLGDFGWGSLNRSLIADGHDPMTVALDPQAAHVDRLARIRLVEGSHHNAISKIKHLRRYQRGGGRTVAGPLLQIESFDGIGLTPWGVVWRTAHDTFSSPLRLLI